MLLFRPIAYFLFGVIIVFYFISIFIIILGSGKFTIDNLKKLRYDIYMLNENKKKMSACELNKTLVI